MDYSIEPIMADCLEMNIKKYYPDSIENDKELYKLITDYGIFICTDKSSEFDFPEEKKDRLIELLIKACLQLSARPCLYEKEYNYIKKYWHPDWEICYNCPKRFTHKCDHTKCNPMDI